MKLQERSREWEGPLGRETCLDSIQISNKIDRLRDIRTGGSGIDIGLRVGST